MSCPVCFRSFTIGLEEHVNACLDLSMLEQQRSSESSPTKQSKILSEFRRKLSSKSTNPIQRLPPIHEKCSQLYPTTLKTSRGYSIPYLKTLMWTRYTVDAFKWGPLEDCAGYFLTHFHSDHYGGLSSSWALGQAPIYCSAITARLATLRLGIPADAMKVLPMNTWINLPYIRVMLIDANHCPGSVMLLFYIMAIRKYVLHTGDCRAGPALLNDVHLKNALSGNKLYAVYLDTTYCAPQHTFPCQISVITECSVLVKTVVEDRQQVRFCPIKRLVLVGSYTIGKERIAISIAEMLGTKIHVPGWKRAILSTFDWPELENMLTEDAQEASVHIVPMNILNKEGLCTYLEPFYPKIFTDILAIRPTGWTGTKVTTHSHDFKSASNGQVRTRKQALTIHSVPYSEHSSFSELAHLLAAFSPEIIIPTVSNDTMDVLIRPKDASPIETLLYWYNLTK